MRSALCFLIGLYRRFISPMLPPHCRFSPSCSEYAIEAIQKHGAVKGLWLGAKRIFRCNPFGSHGYDPVPDAVSDTANKHLENASRK